MSIYGDQLELIVGGDKARKLSSHSGSVEFEVMNREVSKNTRDTYRKIEGFWSILNVISDDKIEKFEWDFVLKMAGRGKAILSEDESDFLFIYLDTNNSGDITKPELRALLTLVVDTNKNKWDEQYIPTLDDMIRCAYEYAFNDKMKSPIDLKLQTSVITVKNKLTKFRRKLNTAKKYNEELNKAVTGNSTKKKNNEELNKAINGNSTALFPNPQEIFDSHLNEHASTIDKYAIGPLKAQYDDVKNLLKTSKKEYNLVNARMKQFVDQADELNYLKARNAKCCKIFGCVCPCAF